MKFTQVFKKFPRAFWVANTMELFERWAWYGLFAVLALYLTNSTDDGALGFTQSQKGSIMGTVTGILYLLPLITGALADRIGYKKILIIAVAILGSGYLFMGQVSSYGLVYFAFLWVALGAALFKPVISATISKTTDDETSSIGFGIFYMMVNIGGFIGPIFSSKLREAYGWKIVFFMAASAIAVNLILVLFFYKEPDREKSIESLLETIKKSLKNIFTALSDVKLTLFLLIMVGFWTMFNQLFYTLPNFIDQWVNTSIIYDSIANISPALAAAIGTNEHTIAPEMMVNLDAGAIILFQIVISTLVMRFKPLNGIISGIIVSAIGIGIAFSTGNGFFAILGIFIFALGEMASSPKFTEYVGKIAPKGKEALYMGTSFLPVAVGNYITGFLSGDVYQAWSDKVSLLSKYMMNKGFKMREVGSILTKEEFTKKLENIDVKGLKGEELMRFIPSQDKINSWEPIIKSIKEFAMSKGVDNLQLSGIFSQNDYYLQAGNYLNMTQQQLTDFLWTTYNPSKIWMLFSAIGIATVICLYLYDKFIIGETSKK